MLNNSEPAKLLTIIKESDAAHLAHAWSAAGCNRSIHLTPFTSCETALTALSGNAEGKVPFTGILVDNSLSYRPGKTVVECLTDAIPPLSIRIISWSGTDWMEDDTARITRTGIHIWRKPITAPEFLDFTKRLHDLLLRKKSTPQAASAQ